MASKSYITNSSTETEIISTSLPAAIGIYEDATPYITSQLPRYLHTGECKLHLYKLFDQQLIFNFRIELTMQNFYRFFFFPKLQKKVYNSDKHIREFKGILQQSINPWFQPWFDTIRSSIAQQPNSTYAIDKRQAEKVHNMGRLLSWFSGVSDEAYR